jgi:predicted MFS family arabinose efflux permease
MFITDLFKNKFNNPFIALKHKNFRIYWLGMCISLIGTWMQNIAQPWLAYSLTKSPFLLSLIGALQFTPVLLFSLFAGVLIDKFPKKRILIFTQSASLIITFILAVLVFIGEIKYWHIVVLATVLGFVNTFDMPARQSIVIELVGKKDLMNAIALNSTVFNLARIIGPAIAGVVMAFAGISVCFFANSFSFAAVLISLFFIKPNALQIKPEQNIKIRENIKAGLKYIYNNEVLFDTLIVVAIVGTFAPNFSVLVPVFSKEILRQQEAGFGFLMSFLGAGSLIGAIFIATISRSGPKKFIMYIVPLLVGAFLILTGFTNTFIVSGIFLIITGFFFVSFSSNANSSMQLNTSDDYRGRVMSVYSLVFAGSTPIGNLYAGIITDHFNSRIGFAACGSIIIILMVLLFVYRIRKINRNLS